MATFGGRYFATQLANSEISQWLNSEDCCVWTLILAFAVTAKYCGWLDYLSSYFAPKRLGGLDFGRWRRARGAWPTWREGHGPPRPPAGSATVYIKWLYKQLWHMQWLHREDEFRTFSKKKKWSFKQIYRYINAISIHRRIVSYRRLQCWYFRYLGHVQFFFVLEDRLNFETVMLVTQKLVTTTTWVKSINGLITDVSLTIWHADILQMIFSTCLSDTEIALLESEHY